MSSTHETIQNFEKVSDLFFDSGDIVISAQRAGGDTLSAPQAAPPCEVDANEYFQEIPVVYLFDDPADLTKFFKVMYAPSTLIFQRSLATNAADAFPLLVLADKYVADAIEYMIEYQIRQDWSKSVYEWDAFESRAAHMYRMHQQKGSDGPWDALVPEPASYIRLARIAKVFEPTRIGAAFYHLSRMNVQNDWETKSIAGGCKDPTPAQLVKMRRAMWSILAKDEMRRLERGKEKLASHMAHFVRTLPEHLSLDVDCALGWNMTAVKLVKPDDILAALLQLCSPGTTALGKRMCGTCLSMTSRKIREERAAVFVRLPDYFEVCPNERAYLDTFCTSDSEFILM